MRWVVAGGGTGGHVTPALALAEGIAARGDDVYVLGGTVGLAALWRLRTGKGAIAILYLAMVAIVAAIALRQKAEAVWNGTMGLVGISLLASLLSRRQANVLAASGVGLAAIAIARAIFLDEPLVELLVTTLVPLIVILVGSQVIEWTKQEISERQMRFENLFDHVPVAIWEEDFSGVAAWLDQLRALGVVDLREYLATDCEYDRRIVTDDVPAIVAAIQAFAERRCALICTTGGTGPAPRDVTPEAIEQACDKMMPGFGEQMRRASLDAGVPTAILSRQLEEQA